MKTAHNVNVLSSKVINNCRIVVASGSVVDFTGDAIVNAANTGGLGGGGVDGAITAKGGKALADARVALPVIPDVDDHAPARVTPRRLDSSATSSLSRRPAPGGSVLIHSERTSTSTADAKALRRSAAVRIPVGDARITIGGELPAKWVIHAVGPMFTHSRLKGEEARKLHLEQDEQLRTAYTKSLDLAAANNIRSIAFSLLSAGVFRGPRALSEVLSMGWKAVEDWVIDANNENTEFLAGGISIYFVAFTQEEQSILAKQTKKKPSSCIRGK